MKLDLQARPAIPASVSPEARDYLSMPRSAPAPADVTDLDAWRTYIAATDSAEEARLRAGSADFPVTVATSSLGGVTVYDAHPAGLGGAAVGKVVVYFHGGGLTFFAGRIGASFAKIEAHRLGCRVVSIDFRVPPDNPYPAGLDDCVAAYAELFTRQAPGTIAFYGVSGGANLALATCLRAKAAGLPLPAGLALVSPQIDLTESGDSFQVNRALDVALPDGAGHFSALYATDRDRSDPFISPLFGDLAGFPPTHIQSGTRDLMLSNAVRLHQRMRGAGVAADLYLLEAGVHGGLGAAAPETQAARREIVGFISRTIGPA